MISLVIGFSVVLLLSICYLGGRSRGLSLSKMSTFVATLAAMAIGTISITHFCLLVLPNQPESILDTIDFALPFLETYDPPNSVCMYTPYAASLATSLGWNIFSYRRWEFNIITQLIMGTSFGVNAGIAAGMTDIPSEGYIAFGAAATVTASLPILNLTLNLFVKWITEQVINKIRNYFYEYLSNFLHRIGRYLMSRVRFVYTFVFGEPQVDDDFPTFDVGTTVAIIGSTLLGGLFGNGHVITYVPFFNIELGDSGWKSFVLSAVVAVATIIGMMIPLDSTWTPLRFYVGAFVGISLGTNAGMIIGQLQMEIVVFVALAITSTILVRRAIRLL